MKKTLLVGGLLVCLLLGGLVTVQGADKTKQQIGYVDMQKLFKNHPRKQASEDELKGKAKELQQKLESQAEDLTKEERQELLQEYQQQLDSMEQKLIQGVMEDINKTIQQVAQEKGVTVVLDKSVVISGGYNLTEDVLAEIEANSKQETKSDQTSN